MNSRISTACSTFGHRTETPHNGAAIAASIIVTLI